MSDIKVECEGELYDMDELDGDQLIILAMCAFLYMKKEHKMPDEKLLADILNWFEIMTADVIEFKPISKEEYEEIMQVPPDTELH